MSPPPPCCPACDTVAPEGARFCPRCGLGLQGPACDACQTPVPAQARFCPRCGSPYAAEGQVTFPAFPGEQLRQVTVLFALISGLGQLLEQVNPEEFQCYLDRLLGALAGEIKDRGGTIDKYMADSLLALFGVPLAHGDDPERAVLAGLALKGALEAASEPLLAPPGVRLSVRVGINTGRVLVGHVGGSQRQVTVMGDVVNTASRVSQAAPEGAVLLCDSTRRLLSHRIGLRQLPPLLVKGKGQPLQVFQALPGSTTRRSTASSPFVGREAEFAVLVDSWAAVVRPQGLEPPLCGRWVTLLGEAGMGKERLVAEFQRYAAHDPCNPAVYVARASALARGASGGVLRQLIFSMAGVLPHHGPEQQQERLQQLVQPLCEEGGPGEASLVLETLAGMLLRLSALDPVDGLDHFRGRDAGQGLALGLGFLRRLLEHLSRERQVLVMALDLQWADELALDFFAQLGSALPPRLMLVTAGRPTVLERRPGWGQGVACHRMLSLQPLTLEGTRGLLQALGEERLASSPRILELLFRFTGGNPRFLVETLRHFLETADPGTLLDREEGLPVPDSIEGVIQGRLDRLPPGPAETVRAAAVLGGGFWRGAVEAMLGRDVQEDLALLSSLGHVERQPGGELPGEEQYVFSHLLVARVALGNLLEQQRQRHHLAAARWLEARAGQAQPLELSVAWHYEQAGAGVRAGPWHALAGDRALSSWDLAAASRHYDRALAAMEAAGDATRAMVRLRLRRGEVRRLQARFAESLVDLEAGATLAERLEAADAAASSWYQQGLVYLELGDLEKAEGVAARGDRLSPARASPGLQALGSELRGELRLARGQLQAGKAQLERASFQWRLAGDRYGLAHNLTKLGQVQLTQDPTLAVHTLREATVLHERLGDAFGLAQALLGLGQASLQRGLAADARGACHRAQGLFRRLGDRPGLLQTQTLLGRLCLAGGYLSRARAALEEALEGATLLGLKGEQRSLHEALVELSLRLGELARGEEHLAEARRLGEETARWRRLQGALFLEQGALEEAGAAARRAFRLAQDPAVAASDPGAEAQALLLQGRIALGAGKLEEARLLLEELEWAMSSEAGQAGLELALLQGQVALQAGRWAGALACFSEAEGRARALDMVAELWEARQGSWEARVWAGDPGAEAARVSAEEAFGERLARAEDAECVARWKAAQWQVNVRLLGEATRGDRARSLEG